MNPDTHNRPWIMRQTWSNLLFAHWPLPPTLLRPLIPARLEIDTFDGQAWLAVVPFYMSGVQFRGLPPLPTTGEFCELNVRTYVRLDGKPGVWFFSLDASSSLAVFGARRGFYLPYYNAEMHLMRRADCVEYHSRRTQHDDAPAEFTGSYRPISPVFQSQPGSLEYWLTERYCLYAANGKAIYRGDIDHIPWPLQTAEANISQNTMAAAAGIALPDRPPLLHFAARIDVRAWYLTRVG